MSWNDDGGHVSSSIFQLQLKSNFDWLLWKSLLNILFFHVLVWKFIFVKCIGISCWWLHVILEFLHIELPLPCSWIFGFELLIFEPWMSGTGSLSHFFFLMREKLPTLAFFLPWFLILLLVEISSGHGFCPWWKNSTTTIFLQG